MPKVPHITPTLLLNIIQDRHFYDFVAAAPAQYATRHDPPMDGNDGHQLTLPNPIWQNYAIEWY